MKKVLVAVLALLALVSLFSGCVKKTYTLPWDQFAYKVDGGLINLTGDERRAIINLLNDGKWEDGVLAVSEDYRFYPKESSVCYGSEEGVFNDVTRKMHLTLSDAEREKINGILKIPGETKK